MEMAEEEEEDCLESFTDGLDEDDDDCLLVDKSYN